MVIPIQNKVARDPNYHLSVEDIQDWERRHGKIPEGSVVFVRSDWSTQWPNPANLSQVPETGALVAIGYPKFQGGLGGYARYIAICPPDWRYGISVGQIPESPLQKADRPLHWDKKLGFRVR